MKYIKLLSLALAATLTSQNAMAIGGVAVQRVDESLEQARKDAEARLAEADAAQKALVKKAAEEAAALALKKEAEAAAKKAAEDAAAAKKAAEEAEAAQKAAAEAEAAKKAAEAEAAKKAAEAEAAKKADEEEAARNAGPEADALKTAGLEINDSNKAAVKLLLDLSVPAPLVNAESLKSILTETTDIKKKAVALLLKTGLYDKRNNTSKKRNETYSYLQAAEVFAQNEKAWKAANLGDLKYWRQHASHSHNKDTVGNVASGRHYNTNNSDPN